MLAFDLPFIIESSDAIQPDPNADFVSPESNVLIVPSPRAGFGVAFGAAMSVLAKSAANREQG